MQVALVKGVYLMEQKRYNVHMRLFQVGHFYVEIFSLGHEGEVIMVNAFDDMSYLESYLEKLELPAFL